MREELLVLEKMANAQVLHASTLARIAPELLGEGPVFQQPSDRGTERSEIVRVDDE